MKALSYKSYSTCRHSEPRANFILIIYLHRCTLIQQLSQTSSGLTDEKIAQIQEDFSARFAVWETAMRVCIGNVVSAFLSILPTPRQSAVLEEVKSQEDLIAKTFLSQVPISLVCRSLYLNFSLA